MTTNMLSQETEVTSDTAHKGARFLPLRSFGFGLYWTWLWVLTFTSLLFMPSAHSLFELTALRATGFTVQAVVLLLAVRFANKLLQYQKIRLVAFGAAILGAASTLIATAGYRMPGSAGLTIALTGWILWGLAGALLTCLWAKYFTSTNLRNASTYAPASSALGAILTIVIVHMQPSAALIVVTGLPVASVCMFLFAIKNVPETEENKHVAFKKPYGGILFRILVGITVYAFVSGLLIASIASQAGRGFDAADQLSLLGPGVLGSLIAIVVAFSRGLRNLVSVYELVLPTMVAGFLLLPFIDIERQALATCIILAGYLCFDVLSYIVLFGIARQFDLSSVGVFILGRSVNVVGHALGWLTSLLLISETPLRQPFLIGASLAAAFVLVLINTLVLREREFFSFTTDAEETNPSSPSDTSPGPWRQCCFDVSRQYNLSPRETEVLILLAKGRDRNYIQNALVISRHTVEAHTYHIYKKMNIHSRQELLDLVEAHARTVGENEA